MIRNIIKACMLKLGTGYYINNFWDGEKVMPSATEVASSFCGKGNPVH